MYITENYLDLDVAYLLGLITARGQLSEQGGLRQIIIEFPYKSLIAEGIKTSYKQDTDLLNSVNQIRDRLVNLLEADISVQDRQKSKVLIVKFLHNSIAWRNLKYQFGDKTDYYQFHVPDTIFVANNELKKEYIRGIADAAGFIRLSNNYMGGKRRVYIEIVNKNWLLPIQICKLLQEDLNVPVQMINWGHPNTREPEQIKKGVTWAREHQIKIFSEAFGAIGFYVKYKDEILQEIIKEDMKLNNPLRIEKCNPNPSKRRINHKDSHPEEGNLNIPDGVRGNHYNAYWQICVALGCNQKCEDNYDLFEYDEDIRENNI